MTRAWLSTAGSTDGRTFEPARARPRKAAHPALLSAAVCLVAASVEVCGQATAPQATSAPAEIRSRTEPMPKELVGVGVTEHPNVQVPLDLEFKDESGRIVRLAEYFKGDRPVILTLNYFRCPMLCTLQLNGLIDALKRMEWTPGNEFRMVTVSFDPTETPTLARLKKQNYLEEYGRPAAAGGWAFLTGRQENIRKLTDTVGFAYRYDEEADQYIHAAALFVCTPDGRVSRYLYGVTFDPQTLRLSLVEAGQGKIGTTVDQVLLFCFHYDAAKGRYGPAAMNLMQSAAVLTLIVVGAVLGVFWRRERRRRRSETPAAANAETA